MELVPIAPTADAPAERFTGDVQVGPLHACPAPSRLVTALVDFAPGARTNWHSHPLGQTLHCTQGAGLVVTRDGAVIMLRPGDTLYTPPGEEHWHGALPDSAMGHLAIVEHLNGESATWLEPVSDADYTTANTHAAR